MWCTPALSWIWRHRVKIPIQTTLLVNYGSQFFQSPWGLNICRSKEAKTCSVHYLFKGPLSTYVVSVIVVGLLTHLSYFARLRPKSHAFLFAVKYTGPSFGSIWKMGSLTKVTVTHYQPFLLSSKALENPISSLSRLPLFVPMVIPLIVLWVELGIRDVFMPGCVYACLHVLILQKPLQKQKACFFKLWKGSQIFINSKHLYMLV